MTAAEFYEQYVARSAEKFHVSFEEMHLTLVSADRRAYPCQCGEPDCPGWAMMPGELIERARRDGVPMTLGIYTSDLGFKP